MYCAAALLEFFFVCVKRSIVEVISVFISLSNETTFTLGINILKMLYTLPGKRKNFYDDDHRKAVRIDSPINNYL